MLNQRLFWTTMCLRSACLPPRWISRVLTVKFQVQTRGIYILDTLHKEIKDSIKKSFWRTLSICTCTCKFWAILFYWLKMNHPSSFNNDENSDDIVGISLSLLSWRQSLTALDAGLFPSLHFRSVLNLSKIIHLLLITLKTGTTLVVYILTT